MGSQLNDCPSCSRTSAGPFSGGPHRPDILPGSAQNIVDTEYPVNKNLSFQSPSEPVSLAIAEIGLNHAQFCKKCVQRYQFFLMEAKNASQLEVPSKRIRPEIAARLCQQ
jgi:hypothetical protein